MFFSFSINTKRLNELGIKAEFVMGDIELEDRQKTINEFKKNEFKVLVTNPHTLAESISLHSVCHDINNSILIGGSHVFFNFNYVDKSINILKK